MSIDVPVPDGILPPSLRNRLPESIGYSQLPDAETWVQTVNRLSAPGVVVEITKDGWNYFRKVAGKPSNETIFTVRRQASETAYNIFWTVGDRFFSIIPPEDTTENSDFTAKQ